MTSNKCSWLAAVVLLLFGSSGPAGAQTITVDIEDASIFDVPSTATVADLPGPDGHISFGEAMVASNNTPGRQTIAFAIPAREWTHQPEWYPGVAVIFGWVPNMSANDEVTIDGTTQTAFTGDTNPNGWEVQFISEFFVGADNCMITGLNSTALWVEGSHCTVENNSNMSVHLYGGFGGSSSAGNVVKGNTGGGFLKIDQSSDNVAVGNTFHRVDIGGYIAGGYPAVNNRIGGPNPADRNHILGTGTWTSQGVPGGYAVQIVDAIGTTIENNWIGLSPDGLSQGHPASVMGIYFNGEHHDTTIRGNRIAGILAWAFPPHAPAYRIGTAIQLYGIGGGVAIVGNKIGLNANDEPVLGSVTGVSTVNYYLGPVQSVVIGGTAAGDGNEIAGHLKAGVSVANSYTGVRISGNSIHNNGGLGIDLITAGFVSGVSANDTLDPDSGGNGLQNHPVLLSASTSVAGTNVGGSLNSLPNQSFSLEFFASPVCDTSGFGEGQLFLGATQVTTNAAGDATFTASLPGAARAGSFVTATATLLPIGSTSEFSACLAVGVESAGDLDGDGDVDGADLGALLGSWGPCSGCPADINGNGVIDGADLGILLGHWG